MASNVWEWTSNLYKSYPYKADDGREDAQSREARVVRGGGFSDAARVACYACRGGDGPDLRFVLARNGK